MITAGTTATASPAATAPIAVTNSFSDLVENASQSASAAKLSIKRAITGVYEPNPGVAPRESVALQSAVDAVELLGESLGVAMVAQDGAPTDRLYGLVYDARTSLMGAQASLTAAIHTLASDGHAAAQSYLAAASTEARDGINKLDALAVR